eukprot:Unigene4834_Nuclearia_a/m.14781 Unigene4834_Nuclearia_a/g.14781  ORF Unigene4834_Nuclearia_a/g.14781 Unigene4834_Nuclearia_a/m.14781 type:complete len:468 (-) Unigene4834_Nuclearia_a:468-1871(-)
MRTQHFACRANRASAEPAASVRAAHRVQVRKVAPDGRRGRFLDRVLDAVLGARAHDDRRNHRVVELVDAREQVVHDLVVERAREHGPEPRAVCVVLRRDDLHLGPVHVDHAALVWLRPGEVGHDVVGLEQDCEPVRRDGVGDGVQHDDLPQRQEQRRHNEPVDHVEHLAGPEHGQLRRRRLVDADRAVGLEHVQDVDVLRTRAHAQQAVDDRAVQVLVQVLHVPRLAALDAPDVAIAVVDVGVGAVDVGVGVVAEHVLVQPHEVGGAVEKVVRAAQQLPHERRMRRREVRAIVHGHEADQRAAPAEHERRQQRKRKRDRREHELRVPAHREGAEDTRVAHPHPRRVLGVEIVVAKVRLDALAQREVELAAGREHGQFVGREHADLEFVQHLLGRELVVRVEHVGHVAAGRAQQHVAAARVPVHPLGHVVDLAAYDDPAVALRPVLGYLSPGVRARRADTHSERTPCT